MLTTVQIKNAQPRPKPYKLFDGLGLYLLVTPSGGKLWRFKYQWDGKEKLLAFGQYDELGLVEARNARDDARQTLRQGRDPGAERAAARIRVQMSEAQTFEALAREWHELHTPNWSPRHAADVIESLETHVFPIVCAMHPDAISPPLCLGLLRQIEARPAIETARRVRQRMSAIFCYGLSTGVAHGDPAAVVLGSLAPLKKGKQPAIIKLKELVAMLRKAEAEPAHPATKGALRFLALTAGRPGEVRRTAWPEFQDLDGPSPLWELPAERMKRDREHVVPLSAPAVAIINAMREYTGRCPFVFPNARHPHKPMSENAMGYLLNRAGYHGHHVPHGFRAAFSSIMNERHPDDADAIEAALAHAVPGVRGRYNRAPYLARRRELAEEWASLIMQGAMPVEELLSGRRR